MGFDRAFPPGTRVEGALAALAADFAARDAKARV
jgi:methylmalonyl-CoA mutase cobalamin-binding subunit